MKRRDVASWPEADIQEALIDVCLRVCVQPVSATVLTGINRSGSLGPAAATTSSGVITIRLLSEEKTFLRT